MLKIEISEQNAAFEDMPTDELARILREASETLHFKAEPEFGYSIPLRDVNGNRVGWMKREQEG